jgi:hypothetical protein
MFSSVRRGKSSGLTRWFECPDMLALQHVCGIPKRRRQTIVRELWILGENLGLRRTARRQFEEELGAQSRPAHARLPPRIGVGADQLFSRLESILAQDPECSRRRQARRRACRRTCAPPVPLERRSIGDQNGISSSSYARSRTPRRDQSRRVGLGGGGIAGIGEIGVRVSSAFAIARSSSRTARSSAESSRSTAVASAPISSGTRSGCASTWSPSSSTSRQSGLAAMPSAG